MAQQAKPELSITMAMAGDYDGPQDTIQTIRILNKGMLETTEFVIVDNDPDHEAGKAIAKNVKEGKYSEGTAGVRYIAFPTPKGTAAPREAAIQAGRGKIIWQMDSHIKPTLVGTVPRLIKWFKNHEQFKGMISGPLVYDDLVNISTHFNPQWRDEMFGIWGNAWEYKGEKFSTLEVADRVQYIKLAGLDIEDSPVRDDLPDLPWYGHEQELLKLGCIKLGMLETDEFDVPGQGLGSFAFRKRDWPGFNPNLRGFGGEEMYIHEKIRRLGGRVLCVGWMPWWHRFGWIGGPKYPLRQWDKVRNNVLTHNEIQRSLDDVKEHFVGEGKIFGGSANKIKLEDWEALVDDPVYELRPVPEKPTAPPAEDPTLDNVLRLCR